MNANCDNDHDDDNNNHDDNDDKKPKCSNDGEEPYRTFSYSTSVVGTVAELITMRR